MILNSPQESFFFSTSRHPNGLPATVSKFGKCILFVGKAEKERGKARRRKCLSVFGVILSHWKHVYEWNCKVVSLKKNREWFFFAPFSWEKIEREEIFKTASSVCCTGLLASICDVSICHARRHCGNLFDFESNLERNW